MDKWLCFCSRADGEEDTVATDYGDNSRPRSIFNLFRRQKSSRLKEKVTEESERFINESANSSVYSESNNSVQSEDHESLERGHVNDLTQVIEETDACSDVSAEITGYDTDVRNSRPYVGERKLAHICTHIKPNIELNTVHFGGNPVLFDLSHWLYVNENTESQSPCEDMEFINFSNINSLRSSFQYSATPNAGCFRDLTNIAVEYCRSVASSLKLEEEYVNVQISAHLAIEIFTESSSDESASDKHSQCPSFERPDKGPAKKQKKNKKQPNVSKEADTEVGAVPVVKSGLKLAISKPMKNKDQPAINAPKGLDSAKTRPPGNVLTVVTETVQPTVNKHLPACQTSKSKKCEPSTSGAQNKSFECKSLEKVTGNGFLVNGKIKICNRNWNCITRTDKFFYCELCKGKTKDKNKVIVHMSSYLHELILRECPVLGDFGNSLIRKVDTGRNHCAICNIAFVETYTTEHCLSDAHTELYTMACREASLVMSKKAKRYRLENFKVVSVDKSNIEKKTSNANSTVKSDNSAPNVTNKTSNSFANVTKKTANSAPNVTNKANRTANSVSNVPQNTVNSATSATNMTRSVPNKTGNPERNVANTTASAYPKVFNSVYKVAGEGVMVNKSVTVSQRCWNSFTGTSSKRYCNVCQTDTIGENGFFHMNSSAHIDTMEKYPILKNYGLNLIRMLPNEHFFCTICISVTQNVSEHLKTSKHCKNYSESLNKTAKILADPSKRLVEWNDF